MPLQIGPQFEPHSAQFANDFVARPMVLQDMPSQLVHADVHRATVFAFELVVRLPLVPLQKVGISVHLAALLARNCHLGMVHFLVVFIGAAEFELLPAVLDVASKNTKL